MIIQGKELPVFIKYKNNKHTYFKIQHDGLHIHASHGMPEHLINAHVKSNFELFYNKYLQFRQQEKEFTLWGIPYEIHFEKGNSQYVISDHTIHVTHENLRDGILFLLKEEMSKYLKSIEQDVIMNLKSFNIKTRTYVLKYYKSKFGAYHKLQDTIYLNTFLATLDVKFLHYVLMHEYAHTIHFHHQKSFYELLEQLHPNYRDIEKSLKSLVIPSDFHV